MKNKIILLSLALVLPGLIFVFLKVFGRNEFSIPIYYQSADSVTVACGTRYLLPYSVPDSSLAQLGWKGKPATLLVFGVDEKGKKMLSVVMEEFNDSEVQQVQLGPDRFDWRKLKDCVFLMKEGDDIVLMDEQKRIRGYYQAGVLEEGDRLGAELNILLKKY